MFTFLFWFQNKIQKVLTYIHGLPDDTWKEPDPEDPLSLVDQVSFCFGKTFYLSEFGKKVELALAYQCEEKIGVKRLLQYIHYNREANALTINAMGE